MDHRRSSSYSQSPSHEGTSQHTSSAFSASAQPNEDWTQISDLAERRRIQNRIAQRNYRKKLKRRLEDLERKASASTSASPEPRPAELSRRIEKSKAKPTLASSKRRQDSPQSQPSVQSAGSTSSVEDWTMFSNQHTRQVSASPPPFAFPALNSFPAPPSPQLPASSYPYTSGQSYESTYHYQPFVPTYDGTTQYHWQDKPMLIKQERFGDSEISPLNLQSYVPISNMDMSFASNFTDPSVTPELCDIYEYSSAGSPGEFQTYPQTPMMLPLSPPFQSFEHSFEQ